MTFEQFAFFVSGYASARVMDMLWGEAPDIAGKPILIALSVFVMFGLPIIAILTKKEHD